MGVGGGWVQDLNPFKAVQAVGASLNPSNYSSQNAMSNMFKNDIGAAKAPPADIAGGYTPSAGAPPPSAYAAFGPATYAPQAAAQLGAQFGQKQPTGVI